MTELMAVIGFISLMTTAAFLAYVANRRAAKALQIAFGVLVLASILSLFKPVRVWASQEGAWIYHWLYVDGPETFYSKNTWKDAGGTTHTGLEISTGTATTAAGTLPLRFLGSMTSAARPSCAAGTEGDLVYDITVHSVAFCDATGWHKLVTGSSTNDSWTSY